MSRPLLALVLGALACNPPARAPQMSPAVRCGLSAPITQTPGFVRELCTVDVDLGGGARASLDALVTRPAGGAPAPLVLLSHGSPRDAAGRAEMSPTMFSGQSLAFARRGYAVAAILRRGFGATGGPFAEAPGPCADRDYVRGNGSAARDVLAAVEALKREPWVDPRRIVLVGHSAGGMASLGAAATGPEGVVAVVSFAGGRGSDAPDHVCQPERLLELIRGMGAAAKVPSAWIYAQNDHFFGPDFAQRMFDAYEAQGAPAEIVFAPAFGQDGHALFPQAPVDLWWPMVGPFLARNHLPVDVLSPRVPARVDPPPTLGPHGVAAFATYLASEGFEKAFAVGEGAWGWSAGRRTLDDARRKALEHCEASGKGPCRIHAVNDAPAP